jgi:S-disulfanyl-L-cysteine oxidoreductase SoxD
MYMRKSLIIATLLMNIQLATAQEPRFGTSATQADIDKRFWSVFPDGEFLPDGEGTVAEGRELFEYNCNMCHNFPDENDPNKNAIGKLFGGHETRGTANVDRTIGSYWPYPTTVFNYIRRAMPLIAPMSLTNSEYYSLTAYLLHENGIIAEDDLINKDTLPKVEMPNRNGFVNAYPEVPEKYKTKP